MSRGRVSWQQRKRRSLGPLFLPLRRRTRLVGGHPLGRRPCACGDNMICLHTLSDTDDLPTTVSTDSRYERLSTDRSDCRLSFASPVGLMLPCNHIYNQYLFIEDSDANLERFEKQARNMHSLARYSRSNQINEELDTGVSQYCSLTGTDIYPCPF